VKDGHGYWIEINKEFLQLYLYLIFFYSCTFCSKVKSNENCILDNR